MTSTTMLRAAFAVAFAAMLHAVPAHAQRVFVSGSGSDSNPCTYAAPCRTFQQAFNTAPVNGEIDVLDPAGYGALTITHGISIQAHGFGGITEATSGGTAIIVNSATSDPITLNGLLLDGADAGQNGIVVNKVDSLQILNCVIRHFVTYGISFVPSNTPSWLAISDTVASDNATGFYIGVYGVEATLDHVRVNKNTNGVVVSGGGHVAISNSVLSNNTNGLSTNAISAAVWLGKSVVSGNTTGVLVPSITDGVVYTYGDNEFNDNNTDVNGALSSMTKQ